ncbi:MAG: hypothetical protein ACOYVJ_02945 [Nitrospirota bacterium]
MGENIRILNEQGINKFRDYLSSLREGSSEKPPYELLDDAWCSAKIPGDIECEKRGFINKMEAAKYLYERIRLLPYAQVESNIGLWSWLSLYYFDQVCPPNEFGKRLPGRDCRHILDLDFRRYYYHLLVGPYNIYKLYADQVPMLLDGPLFTTSKIYLELAARQGFISNHGVIEAANLLYFNIQTKKPKSAVVSKKKPGSILRFIEVIQQLDLTYDLYSMNGTEVLSLLPMEFDEWKPTFLS